MFNLATMYSEGEGCQRSLRLAAYWCEKAAIAGDKTGQYNLGIFLLKQRDYEKALYWMEQAASKGHEKATDFLPRFRMRVRLVAAADLLDATE